MLAGAAFTLASRFDYRCQATFQLLGETGVPITDLIRKNLLGYCWTQLGNKGGAAISRSNWDISCPSATLLAVNLTTTDRRAGLEKIDRLARGFLDQTATRDALLRATPSPAETIIANHLAALEARLAEFRTHAEAALGALPGTDPRDQRNDLLARWETARSGFTLSRNELATASATFQQLQAEPEPTRGIVAVDERSEAQTLDIQLVQDLKELTVRLTELKRHLLVVWQQSSNPLEQLTQAAQTTVEQLGRLDPPTETLPHVEQLRTAAKAYHEMLGTFVKTWKDNFAAARKAQIDPQSRELFDTHQRLRTGANSFLFEAAKHLETMRKQVYAIQTGSTDNARHHVLQSDVTRGFRRIESSHHQFEFAAGALEPRDNFQLDAALRSARGLRRRSQERIQRIDVTLEANAVERSRGERLAALTLARHSIQVAQGSLEQAVDHLVSLQEEINNTSQRSDEFVSTLLAAEWAQGRVQVAREERDRLATRLATIEERRLAAIDETQIELVSCIADGAPINLSHRLGGAGLVALITMFALGFAQWWVLQPKRRTGGSSL